MKKQVVITEQAEAFADSLDAASFKRFIAAKTILSETGFLHAPLAEKIEGVNGLFAIRIMTDANARFFYCYDDGTCIYILSGYLKKSSKIPKAEMKHALTIKKGLGL